MSSHDETHPSLLASLMIKPLSLPACRQLMEQYGFIVPGNPFDDRLLWGRRTPAPDMQGQRMARDIVHAIAAQLSTSSLNPNLAIAMHGVALAKPLHAPAPAPAPVLALLSRQAARTRLETAAHSVVSAAGWR